MSDTALVLSNETDISVDLMVASWLHEKEGLSHSQRTHDIYEEHITKYRAMLFLVNLDLDSEKESLLATVLQAYCSYSPTGKQISASTYMHRKNCLSSFFEFCKKRRWLDRNPTDMLDRRKVHHNDAALPLDRETVYAALQKIDTSTLLGKRDYALLALLFNTGRRVSEMQALKIEDIHIGSSSVIIIWQRCKGNEKMMDQIAPDVAKVLLEYLHEAYEGELRPDAPVWISFSQYHTALSEKPAISNAAIGKVLEKYTGTSKVHTTRHSFAVLSREAGASLEEISRRLGHKNLATTSIYMHRLTSMENPHAEKLAAMLGIGRKDNV